VSLHKLWQFLLRCFTFIEQMWKNNPKSCHNWICVLLFDQVKNKNHSYSDYLQTNGLYKCCCSLCQTILFVSLLFFHKQNKNNYSIVSNVFYWMISYFENSVLFEVRFLKEFEVDNIFATCCNSNFLSY
jgi:hypothetical protein